MLDVSENELGDEGVKRILDAVARMVHEAKETWYKGQWHTPVLQNSKHFHLKLKRSFACYQKILYDVKCDSLKKSNVLI